MCTKKLFWCFILIICILILSACSVQPNIDVENSSEQGADNTAESLTTPFSWDAVIVRVTTDNRFLTPEIQHLNYNSYKALIDNALQKHGICSAERCWEWEPTQECRTVKLLNSIQYSEEYFSKNSLLLITFWNNSDKPFAITDVNLTENTLTCMMDFYNEPPGGPSLNSGYYWSVFIEIDTVLPQQTQFKAKANNIILEKEEFSEKSNAFYEKYVK